jgi:hypothetical protein
MDTNNNRRNRISLFLHEKKANFTLFKCEKKISNKYSVYNKFRRYTYIFKKINVNEYKLKRNDFFFDFFLQFYWFKYYNERNLTKNNMN